MAGFRYAPAVGGAETLARNLVREIGPRLDIDVLAWATSNDETRWLRLLIDGQRTRPERYEVDGRSVTALPGWSTGTRRWLRALMPLYHLPRSPAPSWMGALLARELTGAARGARLLHNVFMGREAFSLGLLLAAQEARIPFVFTPLRHARPLGWNSPAFRRIYREADALVPLTEHEAGWLESQGAPRRRMRVIGVGPMNDPGADAGRARAAVGDGPFVLFLGQMHRYKGFGALLEAARGWPRASDARFVFAGPDVRGNAARAFAGAPANSIYLGAVDPKLRDSLLAACSILCVPSSRESFGIVVVEAWACGKPVIAGTAPATRELVSEGVDGWTVGQSAPEIAGRVAQLLGDPELAMEMGENGRRKVAGRYAWSVIAAEHLDLYSGLGVQPR